MVRMWWDDVQDEVNQEDSEQNKVDGMKKGTDSRGEVMHIWKQLVICNDEDTKIQMVELGWQQMRSGLYL